jgi:hypothetical protein
MDQNRSSDVALTPDDDHNYRDLIDQSHVIGLSTMLIGTAQVLLGMAGLTSFSGFTVSYWSSVFLGGGGWLLIGIGINVFRGRGAFDDPWIKSERVEWLFSAIMLIGAVGLTAGAVFTLLT